MNLECLELAVRAGGPRYLYNALDLDDFNVKLLPGERLAIASYVVEKTGSGGSNGEVEVHSADAEKWRRGRPTAMEEPMVSSRLPSVGGAMPRPGGSGFPMATS